MYQKQKPFPASGHLNGDFAAPDGRRGTFLAKYRPEVFSENDDRASWPAVIHQDKATKRLYAVVEVKTLPREGDTDAEEGQIATIVDSEESDEFIAKGKGKKPGDYGLKDIAINLGRPQAKIPQSDHRAMYARGNDGG